MEDGKYNLIINRFNKTWRPVTVTILLLSLFILYVAYPIMTIIASFYNIKLVIPELLFNHIDSLILGLGIMAGLRTVEKTKNVTNIH